MISFSSLFRLRQDSACRHNDSKKNVYSRQITAGSSITGSLPDSSLVFLFTIKIIFEASR
jgi:hypothetical protein